MGTRIAARHPWSERRGAIYRGTGNGKTVISLTRRFGADAMVGSKSIFSQLESMGYRVLPSTEEPHREQRYVGGYTVQTYGSHQPSGIDAIQLEIGMRLRARPNLERTATDLAAAIAVFAQEYLPIVKRFRRWRRRTGRDGVTESSKRTRVPRRSSLRNDPSVDFGRQVAPTLLQLFFKLLNKSPCLILRKILSSTRRKPRPLRQVC